MRPFSLVRGSRHGYQRTKEQRTVLSVGGRLGFLFVVVFLLVAFASVLAVMGCELVIDPRTVFGVGVVPQRPMTISDEKRMERNMHDMVDDWFGFDFLEVWVLFRNLTDNL